MSIATNPTTGHDCTSALPLGNVPSTPLPAVQPPVAGFADRRAMGDENARIERRQFASSYNDLTPDARELALAIDRYKIDNRRRYITCEEMLAVVKTLGYHRV